MKKYLYRIAIGAGTAGLIVAGAAAFSAFEAHVINVTAKIENALSVTPESIAFGTVFPQEWLHRDLEVTLSQSFQGESRVDDVSYDIIQKLKPVPDEYNGPTEDVSDVDVDDDEEIGPYYPSLCPYLSKHKVDNDGQGQESSVPAFHKEREWTGEHVAYTDVAKGYLTKQGQDTTDKWDIDLAVPVFAGSVGQDWADFVEEVNSQADPNDFILPANLEHATFGCDLWVEVTGISACTVQSSHNIISDTSNTVEETASNAVALSFIHPAWTASIPGATWIWATNPVESPTTVDNTKTFNKTFTVSGTVTSASLDIATDNFYTVYVNGVQVGSEQVDQNNFQIGTQDHYVVTNLVSGSNTIKVVATNKGLANSTPATNPAGVLYKLTYTTTSPCAQ